MFLNCAYNRCAHTTVVYNDVIFDAMTLSPKFFQIFINSKRKLLLKIQNSKQYVQTFNFVTHFSKELLQVAGEIDPFVHKIACQITLPKLGIKNKCSMRNHGIDNMYYINHFDTLFLLVLLVLNTYQVIPPRMTYLARMKVAMVKTFHPSDT